MMYGVTAEHLAGIWPEIAETIQNAVDRSELHEAEDIKKDLETRDAQLWIERVDGKIIALAVTSITAYPKAKVFNIRICTGSDHQSWLKNICILERWAKANGCSRARFEARPGWERILKEYLKTHVILEKEL